MKKTLFLALALFGLSGLAPAATFTWQPNPVDLNDLDHHKAYTWKISSIVIPTGQTITSASLFIDNIRNWDNNPNILFLHLLDTAKYAGIASFNDAVGSPVTEMEDEFAGSNYDCLIGGVGECNPLINHPTEPANTFLASPSFPMNPAQDYTYTFSPTQLTTLASYIASGGDIAFGLDPDCHFFNDGITFTMTTGIHTAPEPSSVLLFGTLAAGLLYHLRKRRAA